MNTLLNHKYLYGTGKFFGWGIVFGCLIGVTASSGPIVLSGAGVFMEALNQEFGWNRAQVSVTVTIYTATTALMIPIVGRLIDQVGARKILIPAIILSALALTLAPLMKQLWHFYAVIFLFSLAGSITTSLPYVRIISLWFDRRRGLFLGIVAAGIGSGFAVVPMLMQHFQENFGWRGAYLGIAALLVFLVLPLIFIFIRDKPADVGLLPDDGQEDQIAPSASPTEGLSFKEAMHTHTFWLLLVMTFVFALVFNGMAVHLVPLLKDSGMSPAQAVFIASIMGMSLFASRIIIGFLLDVVFAPWLALATFLIATGGLGLAAGNLSEAFNILAAILIGVGIGAETDIISYMTSRYFGLRAFGKIYGFFFSFFYVGTGLGPLALGIAYEMNGSYTSTLYWYVAICVAVTLTFIFFGPYKYRPK
ncbi:MAG: MFS family permease [Gammaproteobacteria bacterium]|jgi:MFS family permease